MHEMSLSPEMEWQGDTFILKFDCRDLPRQLGPAQRTALLLTFVGKYLEHMKEKITEESSWQVVDSSGPIEDGPPVTH